MDLNVMEFRWKGLKIEFHYILLYVSSIYLVQRSLSPSKSILHRSFQFHKLQE